MPLQSVCRFLGGDACDVLNTVSALENVEDLTSTDNVNEDEAARC